MITLCVITNSDYPLCDHSVFSHRASGGALSVGKRRADVDIICVCVYETKKEQAAWKKERALLGLLGAIA